MNHPPSGFMSRSSLLSYPGACSGFRPSQTQDKDILPHEVGDEPSPFPFLTIELRRSDGVLAPENSFPPASRLH